MIAIRAALRYPKAKVDFTVGESDHFKKGLGFRDLGLGGSGFQFYKLLNKTGS